MSDIIIYWVWVIMGFRNRIPRLLTFTYEGIGLFVEKLFYKWLLWKLRKNANQEYLSIKEREDLEKRFSAMENKLLQIVPSSEVVKPKDQYYKNTGLSVVIFNPLELGIPG